MTQILKCTIDDRFCVTGVVRGGLKTLRNAKPRDISLELRPIDSDEVLVTKALPWPTGEELPSEIKYDSKKEVILVLNQTTLAQIPFRSHVLNSLDEHHKTTNTPGPQIFSSFEGSANDKKSDDYAEVINTIRHVITDSSDAKWKKLKKDVVSCSKMELSALFSIIEQSQLLEIIKSKMAAGDKGAPLVLKSLLESDFFGYKMLNNVHLLCESSPSLVGLIDDLVHSTGAALPAKTFVKCLKKAAGSDETTSKAYLQKLLDLPFEDKKTAAVAGTLLSASEAATLIGHLVSMYRDEEEEKRHGKVLCLLSLLLDSHSTQFLNDPETHEAVLEAASFIAAMTALTSTFAELECTQRARKEMSHGEPAKPEFQIRTVRLEVRTCPSADMKQSKKDVKMKAASDESDSD